MPHAGTERSDLLIQRGRRVRTPAAGHAELAVCVRSPAIRLRQVVKGLFNIVDQHRRADMVAPNRDVGNFVGSNGGQRSHEWASNAAVPRCRRPVDHSRCCPNKTRCIRTGGRPRASCRRSARRQPKSMRMKLGQQRRTRRCCLPPEIPSRVRRPYPVRARRVRTSLWRYRSRRSRQAGKCFLYHHRTRASIRRRAVHSSDEAGLWP